VRAGYSSRPAAERKRRTLALPADSSAAQGPHRPVVLTPASLAVVKQFLTGTALTFHARAREQGALRP
jgi:hypothetical protein